MNIVIYFPVFLLNVKAVLLASVMLLTVAFYLCLSLSYIDS